MNADERGKRGRSLLRQELSRRVIGAYYDVYGELGYGFVESVYQEAFAIALTDRGASVSREPAILVSFRGRSAGLFRPDLIVDNAIVVELKAVRALEPAHEAQLLNYLRACDVELGLLLNFGPKAEFRRFVWRNSRKLRVSPRSSAVD